MRIEHLELIEPVHKQQAWSLSKEIVHQIDMPDSEDGSNQATDQVSGQASGQVIGQALENFGTVNYHTPIGEH